MSRSSSSGSRGSRTKGYIKNTKTGEMKEFIYNPESFSDSQGVKYQDIESPGSSYPLTQFVSGQAKKISLELFLYDKSGNNKVRKYIAFLEKFLPNGKNRFASPAPLLFVFGSYIEKCVMENIDKEYLEFDTSLEPTRAKVKLSLKKV